MTGNFALKILAKIGLKLTGPVAWLASFLLEKGLLIGWKYIKRVLLRFALGRKFKREAEQDKKDAEAYKQTLNNGASEAAQIEASTNLLNDSKP